SPYHAFFSRLHHFGCHHFSLGGVCHRSIAAGVARLVCWRLPPGLGYSLSAPQNFAQRGVISPPRNQRGPPASVARRRHNHRAPAESAASGRHTLRPQLAKLWGASVMEVKMTISRGMTAFMTGVAPALTFGIAMPQPRI